MADAKRDNNRMPTLLAVSNADGVTPIVLWADPVTHRLLVDLSASSTYVVGPASATNGNIAVFDTTTGKLLKDSGHALSEYELLSNKATTFGTVNDTLYPTVKAVNDQLTLKAPIASPNFTGTPAAPTATAGDSTTQLATTAFVQSAVRSVPSKEASEYATIAALPTVVYYNGVANDGVGATLTGFAVGALGVDSASPAVGNRILVKNQADNKQNGIYTVTATGSGIAVFVMTRALDFNQQQDIRTGASTYVVGGTTLAATTWDVNSADNPVIGTDAITFIQSAGPGSIIAGTGISISGVTVGIDSTVATLAGTQTLTNKTLTTPVVNGAITGTVTPPLTFYSNLNLSEGQMINGRILPSVTSDNLTVALKTLAGTDPSATDPVYVMIGGVVRVITGALYVVANAANNYFNLGSAELATKEVDLFVYLGWDTTNSKVAICFNRVPYGIIGGDYSPTNTSEKQNKCAYDSGTDTYFQSNYNATSPMVVIGRFAATLSAGAGYTWSVPTFTASNLIQRPIYETRWLVWVLGITFTAGTAPTTLNINNNFYKITSRQVFLNIFNTFTGAGATVTRADVTMPLSSTQYGTGVGFLGVFQSPNYSYVQVRGTSISDFSIICPSVSATCLSASINYQIQNS